MGRLLKLALLAALLLLTVFWASPAWAEVSGGALFELHCAGCHLNGGNIVRRNRTLKLKALERQELASPEAIALVAAGGLGSMSGYGPQLGEGGAELVGQWVWEQALIDWKKA